MSVVVTFQLSETYEQYLEANKKLNPDNLLPPGLLTHIVAQNGTGLAVTDVWENDTNVTGFYEGVAASGFQVSALTISKVYDYVV